MLGHKFQSKLAGTAVLLIVVAVNLLLIVYFRGIGVLVTICIGALLVRHTTLASLFGVQRISVLLLGQLGMPLLVLIISALSSLDESLRDVLAAYAEQGLLPFSLDKIYVAAFGVSGRFPDWKEIFVKNSGAPWMSFYVNNLTANYLAFIIGLIWFAISSPLVCIHGAQFAARSDGRSILQNQTKIVLGLVLLSAFLAVLSLYFPSNFIPSSSIKARWMTHIAAPFALAWLQLVSLQMGTSASRM